MLLETIIILLLLLSFIYLFVLVAYLIDITSSSIKVVDFLVAVVNPSEFVGLSH